MSIHNSIGHETNEQNTDGQDKKVQEKTAYKKTKP